MYESWGKHKRKVKNMRSEDSIVEGDVRQQQDRPLGETVSKQSIKGERNDSGKSIIVWTERSNREA